MSFAELLLCCGFSVGFLTFRLGHGLYGSQCQRGVLVKDALGYTWLAERPGPPGSRKDAPPQTAVWTQQRPGAKDLENVMALPD